MINDEHILNYTDLVDNYISLNDWRVKENSTVTYSVGGLILSNSGAVTANYWLTNVYDREIADAHRNAAIHLHDLSMLTGYCAGWSLKQLIQEGLGGVAGKITSTPASHLSMLCNQMVNFIGIMQNEWAGAQAFSSYEEIKNTQLAQMADYIVDGKFEQDKLVTGKMYGSSNQRIIKVKEDS
jgi:anaerobic ribonucleoside-triphosphate reductase